MRTSGRKSIRLGSDEVEAWKDMMVQEVDSFDFYKDREGAAQ